MIDDATQAVLAGMAAAGGPSLEELTPQQARLAAAQGAQLYGPGPDALTSRDQHIDVEDSSRLRVRILTPTAQPTSVVVYFHGGGWVIGDIDGFDALGRKLAVDADAVVVLVDYRKAPESPFPAAVDDAWAAIRWVSAHLSSLAQGHVPLIVAGDSAGGNLAIVSTLRAIAQSVEIDSTVLVYPVTDADLSTPSYLDPQNQLAVSKASMEWFFGHYVAESGRFDPEVSPLRAPDLAGFPPTFMILAEHDPLRSEGEAFAERLRDVGALARVQLFEGQMHGFFTMVNMLPSTATALDDVVRFVRERAAGAIA